MIFDEPIYLDDVNTIAILELEIERDSGPLVQSKACGKDLAEDLSQAIDEEGQFKIVERKRIGAALDELKLQMSDIFSENAKGAKKLGNQIGAQALLIGRVKLYKYDEDKLIREQYTSRSFLWFGEKKKHVEITRKGRANAEAYFSLVDVETGEISAPRNINAGPIEAEISSVDHEPSKIDRDALFRKLRKEIAKEYAALLRKKSSTLAR